MKYGLGLLVLIALSSCNLETILKPLPEQVNAKGQELPAKSSSSVSSKRVALVIGNSAYTEEARLNGPVKDAIDMADVLKGLGFEVILKTDVADLQTMVDAVREFGKRLSKHSVGVFYFSGHGNQYHGENYLMPLRVQIEKETDFEYRALPVGFVLEEMEDANQDGVNLVFLDACRNNPYGGKGFKSGGANKGLTFTGGPKGSLIAYATAPGEIARDSKDAKQNSIYTKHLLAVLREMPRENILQLLTEVRMRVYEETKDKFPKQVPKEENSLMVKEFCLALEGCESTPPAVVATPVGAPKSSPITGSEQPGTVFQDTLKDGSLGPKMVWIPAGKFQMGDIQGTGNSNEKPVHWVEIAKPFAMGQYEITFDDYEAMDREKSSVEKLSGKKRSDNGWGRGDRPVIDIFWDEAMAYANWLSQQTGHTYRLPTEAEWEYAARAGTNTDYYSGNDAKTLGDYAWYSDNSGNRTHPVGKKKPNAFGLYDTAGNVWEWTCSSYTEKYENGKEQGCVAKDDLSMRVFRGGSWYRDPSWLRVASRDSTQDNRNTDIGVRVVRIR